MNIRGRKHHTDAKESYWTQGVGILRKENERKKKNRNEEGRGKGRAEYACWSTSCPQITWNESLEEEDRSSKGQNMHPGWKHHRFLPWKEKNILHAYFCLDFKMCLKNLNPNYLSFLAKHKNAYQKTLFLGPNPTWLSCVDSAPKWKEQMSPYLEKARMTCPFS